MDQGIYGSNFTKAFNKLLKKSGATCYQIAKCTHIGQSYLSRLKNGEKNNPSPETIIKIGLALFRTNHSITITDVEELFNSVGRSIHVAQ